ncbi:transmembrane sensor [Sphingomonas zeicaulis]|uniref:FecR family protein n=1 Tax=Sphingomonas zeicaulis TaxID=1632740 RepID=UPI003D23B3E3
MDGEQQDRDRRRAEAAHWVARLNSKPVARSTLDAFFLWRRAEGNADAFADAERLWSDSEALAAAPEIREATDAALLRGKRRSRIPNRLTQLGLAGAALLAVAAGLLLVPGRTGRDAIETQVGERRDITLADGSQVQLNADTQIFVALTADERRVRLERGEAIFSVTHDSRRPFRVAAGDVVVTATGTRFDVRRLRGATVVTLIDGRVQVRHGNGAAVRLSPGEQWRSLPSASPVVRQVDTGRATAWLNGRVVFDATPLDEALAQINRYAAKPLRLADRSFAGQPVSGSFDLRDTDGFVKAVTTLLPLDATEGKRTISLAADVQRASEIYPVDH